MSTLQIAIIVCCIATIIVALGVLYLYSCILSLRKEVAGLKKSLDWHKSGELEHITIGHEVESLENEYNTTPMQAVTYGDWRDTCSTKGVF